VGNRRNSRATDAEFMPGLRSSNQQCEFALEHPSGNVGQSVSNGVEERIEVVDVHVRSDERRRFA
jgi:hypothetical protein